MKFPKRPGWYWYLPLPMITTRNGEIWIDQDPPTIVRVDREPIGHDGLTSLVARGQHRTGKGLDAWDPPYPQGDWLGLVKAPPGYRTNRGGVIARR